MYKFRLEPMLQIKERLEEGAKLALAQATKRTLAEAGLLEQLYRAKEGLGRELERRSREGLMASDYLSYRLYLESLAARIEGQRRGLAAARKAEQSCREALRRATREKKVLLRLKEKGRIAYQRELGRREQKVIDEVAVIGYGRRQRNLA